MSSSLNIKRLTLALSKHLFYVIIPVSLMGMMAGGGPPGDPYIQAYNTLTGRYAATNQNTNQLLNNYNNQLLGAMIAIRDGAIHASLWAQNQVALAEVDFNTIDIIRQRITIMLGYIGRHARDAQGRSAAVQANVPGAVLLPGDQNILNVLDQANFVDEQAQNALDLAIDAFNRAQGAMQDANNRQAHIHQIINGMNQPILNINYNMNNIQDYYAQNNGIRGALTDFNQANRSSCTAKDYAIEVHNQLNNIRPLIQNIYQLGNNLGIQMPPY